MVYTARGGVKSGNMEKQAKQSYLTGGGARIAWRLSEIAELTGISLSMLRKMERNGELQTTKIGRCTLVLAADLEEFLRGGKK